MPHSVYLGLMIHLARTRLSPVFCIGAIMEVSPPFSTLDNANPFACRVPSLTRKQTSFAQLTHHPPAAPHIRPRHLDPLSPPPL